MFFAFIHLLGLHSSRHGSANDSNLDWKGKHTQPTFSNQQIFTVKCLSTFYFHLNYQRNLSRIPWDWLNSTKTLLFKVF